MNNNEFDLNNFIVTQELVRSLDSVLYWVNFIKNGGKIPRVKLTAFNYGHKGVYIHDGHTRLVAMSLCKVKIKVGECWANEYDLEDYMSVNLKEGYVTPFNPITHVRYSDFFHVKQFILKEVEQGRLAVSDIPKLSNLYSRPRRITFLHELAEKYKPLLESIK